MPAIHSPWRIVLRVLLFIATIPVFCCAFVTGSLMILFASLPRAFHLIAYYLALGGLFILNVHAFWFKNRRWLRRTGIILILLPAAAVIIHGAWRWFTHDRYKVISENIGNWRAYEPFSEGNLNKKCSAPKEFLFQDGIPMIAAAYALYPIASASVEALSTKEAWDKADDYWRILPAGSDHLYDSLTFDSMRLGWGQRRDAVLALKPSEAQIQSARKEGVQYHLAPIARDAFVFFVHSDNPVTNLTSSQIRDIYSGRAKSWRELGVPLDAKLLPFQRNKNSGSQTALERLMGDDPIMPPMEEDRLGGMGDIFRDVADYRNRQGAIGFSFRYYANEMIADGKIRLLAIDGIEPTLETIRSGTYPFVEDSYVVTTHSPSGDVERLVRFLQSDAGRKLVEDIGYVAPTNAETLLLP